MMYNKHSGRWWRQFGLCVCACAFAATGYGKTVQVTLREQLNQKYTNELVYFPFSAPRGRARRARSRWWDHAVRSRRS